MKLSFTTLGCPDWTLDDILRRTPALGYTGVDFRGYAGEVDLRKLPEFTTGIRDTARQVREAGLAISGLSSSAHMFDPTPETRRASLDEMKGYAEMCHAAGVPFLRIFGGALHGVAMGEALPRAAETLRAAAEIAAAAGITIMVETHDDWVATPPLARVFELAGAPANTAILWDVHHPFRIAGESPAETFANIGRHTCYTHWKDSRATPGGKYELCRFGEGDLPLREIYDTLVAGGYDGWHTFEWEKRWHPELPDAATAFPDFIRVMRSFENPPA